MLKKNDVKEKMEDRLSALNWQTLNKDEREHMTLSMRRFRKEGGTLAELKSDIDDIIWGNYREV